MIRCRLLLIIVAALSAAVNRPAPAQAPSNSTQSFVAVRDEWIKDWKSRNLDGLRTLYAPDAVFLPALGVGIQGRDAIGDYLKQLSDSTVGALFVVPYGPGGRAMLQVTWHTIPGLCIIGSGEPSRLLRALTSWF
jgi:hypothetical protein